MLLTGGKANRKSRSSGESVLSILATNNDTCARQHSGGVGRFHGSILGSSYFTALKMKCYSGSQRVNLRMQKDPLELVFCSK